MAEKIKKEVPAEDGYIKMDYSIDTVEGRLQKVNEIITNTPSEKLTSKYLDAMGKYLIDLTLDKKKDKHKILTDNRMITVNKREMSFEGLTERLENGEDGIYNMIANDKNIIFTPKLEISEDDLREIPGLKELREELAKDPKNIDEIKAKKDKLQEKAMALATKVYENVRKEQEANNQTTETTEENKEEDKKDNVADADYEEK